VGSATGAFGRRFAASRGARAARQTLLACLSYRVTGLAAEAAFFTVLSLPPLIFGLAGAIGFVASTLDVGTVANVQVEVLALGRRVLTEDIVNTILAPTLESVLSRGSAAVVSVGFLVALWSGSRAVNVFVDTITIMYGLAGRRGFVQTRLLSFAFYLVLLVIGVVLVPLVLAGPGFVNRILPARLEFLGGLYWPVVLLGAGLFLAGVYDRSLPLRSRWRSGLPGAALALLIWVLGSVLLRVVLSASGGSSTIYGPLAAPIAVLIWVYVMALAVLVGAAFNAAADGIWPGLTGIDPDEEVHDTDTRPTT
jgi:membrane protein